MKDATIPVAICLVGLVCIVLWLVTAGPVHLFSPPAQSVQSADVPPVVATPAKKPEAPRKKFSAPAPVIVEEAAVVAPLPTPAPVVSLPPPVAAKPVEQAQFPAASQIAIGTEKTALTTTFGEPTLSATSTNRGHLDETLVYARENGRRVTMINLEDGKARSAH